MFRHFAACIVFLGAFVGVASAADMPLKAPKPLPPPAFDWNGFYVGVYGGAGWMDQATTPDPCNPALALFFGACAVGVNGNFVSSAVPTTSQYDMNSSFNGGARIGYNWQPTPYTLIGLENDFGYLHLKGSNLMNPGFPFGTEVATTKLGDWYDAYTARVGAVDGHALFYVKAGGVTARYSTGVVFTPTPGVIGPVTLNTTTTKDLSGWAAGAGIEYGIDMHWSVRAEYLVLGLARNVTSCGTAFAGGVPFPGAFCTVTHTPDVQTVTVGLNYRFH